jgi:hypothetical protein
MTLTDLYAKQARLILQAESLVKEIEQKDSNTSSNPSELFTHQSIHKTIETIVPYGIPSERGLVLLREIRRGLQDGRIQAEFKG